MAEIYKIYGAEPSPYSVKVRSYFRYKAIPHEWISRSQERMEEYQALAKLPLIPLVALPEGGALQDSTPIIEKMEVLYPSPSISPDDPALKFISELIEEYGDEWGNKYMFHYRWWYEPDQIATGKWLAETMMPNGSEEEKAGGAAMVQTRMVPRISFVGSSEVTKPIIEASLARTLDLIEAHLQSRAFLFGGRPAMADFGLYAQLYEASCDPTAGAIIKGGYPKIMTWINAMLNPHGEGEFESWAALAPTLLPFLTAEVGGLFLPWSVANAQAIASGAEEFTVELEGKPFTQGPQKYHARSLAAIKAKYDAVADRTALDAILKDAGLLEYFS